MKDVYLSPDKSYVVAFFRDPQSPDSLSRLEKLTTQYKDSVFNQVGGEYWKNLFCWPDRVVKDGTRVGITAPAYQKNFYFKHGSTNTDQLNIRGKEKDGKWFATASLHFKYLDQRERGNWVRYLQICIQTARAVKRLHAGGLAHSDLSYKNVLVDPSNGRACIIDLDGLVVPGLYPPDVVGTPDFIAPEVVMTSHLDKKDPNRNLPNIKTDRHALAVLIYMYLLYRHPLKGSKMHSVDSEQDNLMMMGQRALFVEHPTDKSNPVNINQIKPADLPWGDPTAVPHTITGPYLSELFIRAFIDGLHVPDKRPTADEWETALVKTVDLLQPCQNSSCSQQWYVFDNSTSPACPFCGTAYIGQLPVLNLYSSRRKGKYNTDNHRLMVYTNQSLFPWHVDRLVVPSEKLTDSEKSRVGYFVFHDDIWWLVNERMDELKNAETSEFIPIGEKVAIEDGIQLLFSSKASGRLAIVQMVQGRVES